MLHWHAPHAVGRADIKNAILQHADQLIPALELDLEYRRQLGAVIVAASVEVPVIALLWFIVAREKLLKPARELLAIGLITGGYAVGTILWPLVSWLLG